MSAHERDEEPCLVCGRPICPGNHRPPKDEPVTDPNLARALRFILAREGHQVPADAAITIAREREVIVRDLKQSEGCVTLRVRWHGPGMLPEVTE